MDLTIIIIIYQTTRRYIPESRDLDIYPLTTGHSGIKASSKQKQ